jgi:hypothetical protein
MEKKDIKKIILPAKIEAAKYKIYKIDDIIKLSKIFFPQNAAFKKRASFVAIFIELRKAKDKKLKTLNHIPSKYDIAHSIFTRARSKMKYLGLITKYGGYWMFSTGFASSMKKMAGILKVHQQAPETNEDHLEYIYVEAAKSEDILYRKMEDAVSEQRRIKEQQEDKEKWDKWNEVQNQD